MKDRIKHCVNHPTKKQTYGIVCDECYDEDEYDYFKDKQKETDGGNYGRQG